MSSWHSGQVEDLLKQFESSPSGISEQQAQERLKENGFNQLAAQKKQNLLLRVLVQMKDPMILVLLAAAALSFWASGGEEWLDAAIILMIVCVNQVISISQEDKAQQQRDDCRQRDIYGAQDAALFAAVLFIGCVRYSNLNRINRCNCS